MTARTRNRSMRKQYAFVHLMCTVIFCLFTFLYLYYYQCDILAMSQHVLSGGATRYDELVGASLITFVLFVIQFFVFSLVRLTRWFYWLTYVPSLLILAILTDVTFTSAGGIYNNVWLWLAPVILVLYILVVRIFGEVDSLGKSESSVSIFSKTMWVNAVMLSLCMLAVTALGNNDTVFHNRVKIEREILSGRYDDALKIGDASLTSDSSTTMLLAYALAVKGVLPERLFEYPVVGGSSSMKPDGHCVTGLLIDNSDIIRFVNRRFIGRRNVNDDYELCGKLADCSLDRFRTYLSKYYPIDTLLPKHYKEALMIADGVSSADTVGYADSAMVADYAHFSSAVSGINDKSLLKRDFLSRYSRTYWYYYWCRKHRL